jgi:enolase-phosphatase E1
VTLSLGALGIRGVVLDIEGTTTPIAFVYDVLFPYARERLASHLEAHVRPEQRADLVAGLADEHAEELARGDDPPDLPDTSDASLVRYLTWMMDRDRKSPALKLLQGWIWELGYADGTLKGEVYPDVPPALTRWQDDGLTVAIYSSGSVLAQQLIFGHSTLGDLTGAIDAYFDTAVGPKRAVQSYGKIAERLGLEPTTVLFVSDVVAELEAARAAGLRTALCVRRGNAAQPPSTDVIIRSFDEIRP